MAIDSAAVERNAKKVAGVNDAVVNFAAESHVDRSIGGPADFIQTDVFGTYVLLEAARRHEVERYLQISTDEVYGHIHGVHRSLERDCMAPRSPYAASKGAITSATKSWSTELAPKVRVNSVAPGWVDTDMCVEPFADDAYLVVTLQAVRYEGVGPRS